MLVVGANDVSEDRSNRAADLGPSQQNSATTMPLGSKDINELQVLSPFSAYSVLRKSSLPGHWVSSYFSNAGAAFWRSVAT